jgi:hypothetical protein
LYGSVRVDLPLLTRGMFSICDAVNIQLAVRPQLKVSGQSNRLSVITGSIFFECRVRAHDGVVFRLAKAMRNKEQKGVLSVHAIAGGACRANNKTKTS